MQKEQNRWIIVIAAMVIMLCSGGAYIWGIFQAALVDLFGWQQSTAALTFSICFGVFAIGCIVGGRIQDKYGPRQIATTGGALIGLGMFLSCFSTPDKPWILYMSYGAIMGFGVGAIYTPIITCCSKWFPDKKGTITGLTIAAMGLGGLVFTPVGQALIASKGVLTTFAILGIVFGVLTISAAQFLKNPPPNYRPAGWTPPDVSSTQSVSATCDFTTQEMIKTKQFYLLAFVMLVACTSALMVIPFAKVLGLEAGLSVAAATGAVMLISLGNSLGRFFWGAVSDKYGRVRTLMFLCIVSCITMIPLISMTGWITLVGIGIISFCYGGFLGTFPATNADFFGTKNMGANYGVLLLFFGGSGLIAPMIAAMIKDTTGNFRNAFIIGVVGSLLCVIVTYFLKPPTKNLENSTTTS